MRMNLEDVATVLGCHADDCHWIPEDGGDLITVADPFSGPSGIVSRQVYSRQKREFADWLRNRPWSTIIPGGGQIDSRLVRAGDIFFCIKGEHVDGHDFALPAIANGAVAVVAAHNPPGISTLQGPRPPIFVVPDTVKALQRLARSHRDTSSARVVGVTGTAGKTSVKEALARVLAEKGQTERNPMNKNNSIGLPMSMLNASANASFWVMEAGISQPGDMDELGGILRPDVGLILNVGEGHLEGLGDKGVAHYKSRLFEHVLPHGVCLYSADYPELAAAVEELRPLLEEQRTDLLAFSTERKDVFCHASYIGGTAEGLGRFAVSHDQGVIEVEAPFRGKLGSENVAAISAVAFKLGLTAEEICRGLKAAKLPSRRFNLTGHGPYLIADDSYNANPLSSGRILEVAGDLAREAGLPLILVMGEMGELGSGADTAHLRLGQQMAGENPAAVFWKGACSEQVRRGLNIGGYAGPFVDGLEPDSFRKRFPEIAPPSGLVLVKGSRMNRLEELVDILAAYADPEGSS